MLKTAFSKAVGGVEELVRVINLNTVYQISALFEVGVLGLFLTISSTRGIADAISNWFESTRLYSIARLLETVLSAIREGRIRAAGSISRAWIRSSTRDLATIYIS